MKSLILVFSVLVSVVALADAQCLQNATNDELLAELQYRLGSPNSSPVAEYSVSFSCKANYDVEINSTSLSSGANSTFAVRAASWDACTGSASLLNAKIGNVSLWNNKIVAFCKANYDVVRVLISASAVKQVSAVRAASWDACVQEADLVNRNLTRN